MPKTVLVLALVFRFIPFMIVVPLSPAPSLWVTHAAGTLPPLRAMVGARAFFVCREEISPYSSLVDPGRIARTHARCFLRRFLLKQEQ